MADSQNAWMPRKVTEEDKLEADRKLMPRFGKEDFPRLAELFGEDRGLTSNQVHLIVLELRRRINR